MKLIPVNSVSLVSVCKRFPGREYNEHGFRVGKNSMLVQARTNDNRQ